MPEIVTEPALRVGGARSAQNDACAPVDDGSDIETVVRPFVGSFRSQLTELWAFRRLLLVMVWHAVRVELVGLRFGPAWGVARPLLLAVVFGTFRHLSSADTGVNHLPYPLYIFSGLLLWTYIGDATTNAAGAFRASVDLLSKVYFPRLITPIVPTLAGLVTIAVGAFPLIAMMAWYGVYPGWRLVLLPLVLLPCVALVLGVGTCTAVLALENRDWERVLGFALTIGLWVSPVIYAPDLIPDPLQIVYHANPLAGVLLAFRSVLFADVPFPVWEWLYSVACSMVVLAIGLRMFRSAETELVERL